jgi:hypothetical protein
MTASAFVRDGRSAISPWTASKLAMPVRSRSPALIEAAGQASTSLPAMTSCGKSDSFGAWASDLAHGVPLNRQPRTLEIYPARSANLGRITSTVAPLSHASMRTQAWVLRRAAGQCGPGLR